MTRTILLALSLAGCASAPVQAPEIPRIHCIAYGAMPDGGDWWLYLCTFTGEPPAEPPAPDDVGSFLGGAS